VRSPWKIVALVSIGASMSSLDLTLMFVAFPEIQKDFPGVPRAEISWVLTSFTIVAASLLIPAGRFADRLGRKRVYLSSLLLFTVGSALVALAPTVPLIIAARVVQAIGGAMLTPSSLAIIMSTIEPQRRSTAIGTWSAISGTVTSAAPTVGAAAIEFGSWRWAFFIVVPIGLTCFFVGRRWLVESIDENAGPLPDPFGSVLVFVGVAALAFAIVQSREWGWLDQRTAATLAFAAAVGLTFIWRCTHHPVPVIDISIFRTGSFRANASAALVVGCAFWGVYGVLVVFLTRGWGYSVMEAGLLLTPMTFASTLTSFKAGVLMDRHGHRAVMIPAAACFSIGALLLLFFAGDEPNILFVWIPAALLIGFTTSVYFTGVNSAASRMAPPEHFGVVAGVVQTLIRIGGATGAAFGVTLVADVEAGDGVGGFHTAWLALAVAGAMCMALAWPLKTKTNPRPTSRPTPGPATVIRS
jgi:EmrB/QacA subfamily drug resistance transporter